MAVRAITPQPTSCSPTSSLPQPLCSGRVEQAGFQPPAQSSSSREFSLSTPLAACWEVALCNFSFPFSFHSLCGGPWPKSITSVSPHRLFSHLLQPSLGETQRSGMTDQRSITLADPVYESLSPNPNPTAQPDKLMSLKTLGDFP